MKSSNATCAAQYCKTIYYNYTFFLNCISVGVQLLGDYHFQISDGLYNIIIIDTHPVSSLLFLLSLSPTASECACV